MLSKRLDYELKYLVVAACKRTVAHARPVLKALAAHVKNHTSHHSRKQVPSRDEQEP
jgi:hypothetical protein